MSILLISLLFSFNIFAEKLDCPNLNSCIKNYSKISGTHHISQEKLDKKNFRKFSFDAPLSELEKVFTFTLHQNGLTRVSSDNKTFFIISARDVRHTATSLFDQKEIEKVPKTYDYMMLTYKMQDINNSTPFTRSFRPFMSRYGRIIDNKSTGYITLQDTGVNIHRAFKLLKKFDIKLTDKQLEEIEKKKKHNRKKSLIEAQACVSSSKK